MTRETKIGLLIGLGFIVVFAVLLSHTGPGMPTGDKLALGLRNTPGKVSTPNSTPTNPTYVPVEPVRTVNRGNNSLGSATTRPTNGVGLGDPPAIPRGPRDADIGSDRVTVRGLPNPVGIKSNRTDGTSALASDGVKKTEWEKLLSGAKTTDGTVKPLAINPSPSNLATDRVAPLRKESEVTMAAAAPTVADPSPAVRPSTPSTIESSKITLASAAPAPSLHEMEPGALYETAVAPAGTPSAPPVRQAASKDYVVQKGDTLRKIVKDSYGVTSTKAVEFLVASNKSKIKDKHTIVEGQKLVIPPLPPEMFEGTVSNIDVSGAGDGVRTVTSEELSKVLAGSAGKQRTAPPAAKKDLIATPATAPADLSLNVLVKRDKGSAAGEKTAKAAKTEKSDKLAVTVDKLGGAEKAVAIADKPEKSEKSGYRIYEVKAGDTPRTISARELGSANHSNEILKLNPTLDPTKMKVGTKIKIPDKKPLASIGGVKQVLA